MFENSGYSSQPQGSVQINWGNPLSRSLVIASIGGGSVGDLTPYTAINSPSNVVGMYGTEGFLDIALSQSWQSNNLNLILRQAPFTVMAIIRPISVINQAIFTAYFSGTEYHELLLTNSGVISAISAIGGTAAATSGAAYSSGETMIVAARFQSDERSVFKNGRKLGTNTTAKSPSAATSNRWGVWNGTTERFNGGMVLRIGWNRALSDAEIASVSANPWQLFQRRNVTPIFTPIGDSGVLIPDLSSPGVIDVTSNSAKPELNVQY